MDKVWLDRTWEEYIAWMTKDKQAFKKINKLIKSIDRNGYNCEGHPEPLRENLAGWWSVHFTKKDRLVFRIKDGALEILQVGTHYRDK